MRLKWMQGQLLITFKQMAGRRIEKKRIAAGYSSQTALAKAMEISASRVSDWEKGKREPKGDLRRTLLRLINATEDEIFGIDAPTPSASSRSALAKIPDTIDFLSRFSKLIPAQRDLVLAVVFDDETIVSDGDEAGWPQWLTERLSKQAT